jgi:hypothetical protein
MNARRWPRISDDLRKSILRKSASLRARSEHGCCGYSCLMRRVGHADPDIIQPAMISGWLNLPISGESRQRRPNIPSRRFSSPRYCASRSGWLQRLNQQAMSSESPDLSLLSHNATNSDNITSRAVSNPARADHETTSSPACRYRKRIANSARHDYNLATKRVAVRHKTDRVGRTRHVLSGG